MPRSLPYADMDKVLSLSKRRGFVFQSSEVYGGLASTWDYGPLGVELKRNVKEAWWRSVVRQRDDVVGLDAAILMHPQAWVASGHVENFSDPLVECRNCHLRFRSDHIESDNCPQCGGEFTDPRPIQPHVQNLYGPCRRHRQPGIPAPRDLPRGIFVNFPNVLNATRKKLPFGIAQIGKAFRNRDHARELHFPHPGIRANGSRVLRQAPATTTSGCNSGLTTALPGISLTASAPKTSACAATVPTNWPTTPRTATTSSTVSPGAGPSLRASPTAPISTSASTPSPVART